MSDKIDLHIEFNKPEMKNRFPEYEYIEANLEYSCTLPRTSHYSWLVAALYGYKNDKQRELLMFVEGAIVSSVNDFNKERLTQDEVTHILDDASDPQEFKESDEVDEGREAMNLITSYLIRNRIALPDNLLIVVDKGESSKEALEVLLSTLRLDGTSPMTKYTNKSSKTRPIDMIFFERSIEPVSLNPLTVLIPVVFL